MSRLRFTEVTCDNCKEIIGHFGNYVTECIREEGGIVNKDGDFCNKSCSKQYKKRIKHDSDSDNKHRN